MTPTDLGQLRNILQKKTNSCLLSLCICAVPHHFTMFSQVRNLWHDCFHLTFPLPLLGLPRSLVQTQNPLPHSGTQVCPRPQCPPHTPKIPSLRPTLLPRTALKLQLQPKISPSFLYLLLNASTTLLTSPRSVSHSPKTFSCVYFKSTRR